MAMISAPTVLIIGAGASREYELPTGAELKNKLKDGLNFYSDIGHVTRGDKRLWECLQHLNPRGTDNVTPAGRALSASIDNFPSIDEALHWWKARADIVQLGKLAIAYYILEAERSSPLAIRNGYVSTDKPRDAWLSTFLSIALAGIERGDAEKAFENVTIINFNYDRTMEHYLYWALQRVGVSATTAAESVDRLKVIRPYGSLGRLEWLPDPNSTFGSQEVTEAAKNIRTFTEQIEGETIPRAIDDAFECASVFIFLGFGFHPQNLELLKPFTPTGSFRPKATHVFATTFGIDPLNDFAIASHLRQDLRLPNNPTLVPCQAGELLINLRPTIGMATNVLASPYRRTSGVGVEPT
jgi:hypothetical protein